MVIFLAVSIAVALLALGTIPSDDAALTGATFAPSIVALIWLACYLVAAYFAFGTPYLFASAYIVSLFVFHFGLLIQDGFGIIRVTNWISGPISPWAVRAGWYTNLALACTGIGFALSNLTARTRRLPVPQVAQAIAVRNFGWLRHQGMGLLLAAFVLFTLTIATQGNIFALTRLTLFHLSDTRFISVFSMISPGAATALLISARTKRQRLLAYAVTGFVLLFFLGSGQRSTALFPLLVGVVIWAKTGRRINPVIAAVVLFSTLLIIPMVGYLRTLGTYGEIANSDAFFQATKYADLGRSFQEMGGSIGPLIYTLMLIPADESYRYGNTYWKDLLDLIPNIGLTPDASTARETAEKNLRSGPTREALHAMTPGDWASYHIIPDQFSSGGGAGFSGVAEPYFNFGLPGVLVYFVLLGFFLGKFERVTLPLQPYWLLFAAVIYWHLLPTVRNDYSVFLKPAAFTLIILGIWKLVGRIIGSTRSTTQQPGKVVTQKPLDHLQR
ncbi:MAG: O-antigen polysaccharide polymerase Wzy [Caldilineaceae bacterium]|nr:O-antigen polysaccharide polymerase Wzy [Caldilineaceae bacterium]